MAPYGYYTSSSSTIYTTSSSSILTIYDYYDVPSSASNDELIYYAYNNAKTYCYKFSDWCLASDEYTIIKRNPRDALRDIIHSRCAPAIISNRLPLSMPTHDNEQRAREALLKLIGHARFKRFLSSGFVSVKAKSGRIYQIFPGAELTAVYEGGKMVCRLCVVLDGNYPPTDHLIMRYLMILADEDEFIKRAIKHSAYKCVASNRRYDDKSLVELWKELKCA